MRSAIGALTSVLVFAYPVGCRSDPPRTPDHRALELAKARAPLRLSIRGDELLVSVQASAPRLEVRYSECGVDGVVAAALVFFEEAPQVGEIYRYPLTFAEEPETGSCPGRARVVSAALVMLDGTRQVESIALDSKSERRDQRKDAATPRRKGYSGDSVTDHSVGR